MATVLIADDDAAVRRLLSAVLRPRGHTIIEAGNGEQALELAESENPHLIVSDLLMPAMDGYELVRRLRIEPRTALTPVIFLTAEYDESDATELARSAGVTRVLRKPCKPSDVLEAVHRGHHEIGDDELGILASGELEGLLPIAGFDDGVATRAQHGG